MYTDKQHSFVKRADTHYETLGCRLSESRYPPHLRMGSHSHEKMYFGTVLRGSYSEQSRAKTHQCDRAAVVIHPAGETHSVSFHDAPTCIFRVELDDSLLRRIESAHKLLEVPQRVECQSAFYLMTQLYREFLQPDDVSSLAIEGLILEILAEARRSTSPAHGKTPSWLSSAIDFLNASFKTPLRISEVASTANVHPVYLAREFRRRYGITVGEYVRRLRVQSACRALSTSDLPISHIASDVGFSDQSHLGKHFKRLTGFTPAEYRARVLISG